MYARPRKPCMTRFDLRAHCIASLEVVEMRCDKLIRDVLLPHLEGFPTLNDYVLIWM